MCKLAPIILLFPPNVTTSLALESIHKEHFYAFLQDFYPHTHPACDMQEDDLIQHKQICKEGILRYKDLSGSISKMINNPYQSICCMIPRIDPNK